MSTSTLDRPGHFAPQRTSNFVGTMRLLRLHLRRDRVSLPLWILLLSLPLATVYVGSIEKVYPTQAPRAGFAVVAGAVGAAGLLPAEVPRGGSVAFGAALAGSGVGLTAVAAVTAQLSASARFASGAAFSVLGAAFTLRAIGDASSGTLSWL